MTAADQPDAAGGADHVTGWVMTGVCVANSALLVIFRLGVLDAGGYGAAAWPFLLGHFLVCGALCYRASSSLLRAAPRPVGITVGVAAGAAGVVGGVWAWGAGPNPGPLLARVLAWAAVPAVVWGLAAPRRERAAALAAAVTLTALWVGGAVTERATW